MKQLIVLFCMVAVCKGTFFPQTTSETEGYKLCIYSKDPSQFLPKCFSCLKIVYTNALQACVNGTSMPSNITYSSANCMEKNCQINYPKEKEPSTSQFDASKFIESLGNLFRMRRSVDDNKVVESSKQPMIQTEVPGWKIVAEIATFASDLDFEIDYTT